MGSVAVALRRHAPAWLKNQGDVPVDQKIVLDAITRCRTGALGGVQLECRSCRKVHWIGRSCGNRHCPNCQKAKSQAWLAKQSAKLLPVHHFLVTFTVPKELRGLLRAHKRDGYDALMKASAEAIVTVGGVTRSLRDCKLGFFGILHTWGRDLHTFHPHVHYVVPGGGFHELSGTWRSTPENFLLHHGTLCRVYRAKLKAKLTEAGLIDQVPPSVWKQTWTVDLQPVGDGRSVLKYLAPYVYRVAISDKRVESVGEETVTYRVHPSGGKPSFSRTVPGESFVASFLQHVLPKGFRKIRYHGWMAASSGRRLIDVRWSVWLHLGWTFTLSMIRSTPPSPEPTCEHCGGEIEAVKISDAEGRTIWARGPPLRETG